jgi:coenzyme F420 hydrogenase subunit beta
MAQTIQKVLDDHLCCNCGTCAGVCPQQAISLSLDKYSRIYEPEIRSDACNGCGICYDTCPGHYVDFKGLNKNLFGKEAEDIILGSYLKCYLGHATESKVRYKASSGGVVTGLLIYALEHGIIDGALVTRMNKERPWEPEPFIARTRDEIIEASKSKYCPVPANIMIKELLSAQEGERFAVVGLPCHIQGIRKAEQAYKKLRARVVIHIGLFCSHTDTFWQTDYLLKSMDVSKDDLKSIRYRGGGWPGTMSVQLKSGRESSVPFHKAIFPHIVWFNAMNRCLYCCDLTAELADISVGDPWIPEVVGKEKIGQSIVIVRTDDAQELILRAVHDERLNVTPIPAEKVKESVSMGETKKVDVQIRMALRKMIGKSIPDYNADLMAPRPHNYVRGFVPLLSSVCSSNVYFRPLGEKVVDLGSRLSEMKRRGSEQ